MATGGAPKPGLYISPPLAGRDTIEVCGRRFAKYFASDIVEIAQRARSRATMIEYTAAIDSAGEDARKRLALSAAPGPGDFIALGIPECGASWPLVEVCVWRVIERDEPRHRQARAAEAARQCATPGSGEFSALGIPERGASRPHVEASVRRDIERDAPRLAPVPPAEAMRLCAALFDAVARAGTSGEDGTERELLDALASFVSAAGGEPADFYATGAPLAAVAAALHAQLRGEAGRDAYRAIVREGDRDAAR